MNFKNYLVNESRSKELSANEALNMVYDNCSDMLEKFTKDIKIYRGIKRTSQFLYYDKNAIAQERVSPYIDYNFYTLLLNNLPSWKSYPKRKIICTTDMWKASNYSDNYPYIVFPFNGAKIGVCPAKDIWDSFDYAHVYGSEMNLDLGNLIQYMDNSVTDKALKKLKYSEMLKYFSRLDKFKDEGKLKFDKFMHNGEWLGPYIHTKMKLIDYLNDVLSPKINGFRLYTTKDFNVTGESEVWLDSPCVLLKGSAIKELLKERDK
jgi:hypothetical protein